MKERLISVRQTWAAIVALGLASGLSCGLVILRKVYAGSSGQLFSFGTFSSPGCHSARRCSFMGSRRNVVRTG